MPYTYERFVTDFAEFSRIPQPTVERRLRFASRLLNQTEWGTWYEMAVALWAAHFLALDHDISQECAEMGLNNPYDQGFISSQSVSTSGMSISKTADAMRTSDNPANSELARTSYGTEFLALLHAVIAPVSVVFSLDTSSARGLGETPH